MAAIEICLIVAGLVLMVGSFFVAEKLSPNELDKIAELSQAEIAHIVDKEIAASHDKVQEQLEVELEEILAKLDRESDRETNEKIMAISEYSDTVMEAINKSHNEIMFLYTMLGDKHKEVIDFSNALQERMEKMKTAIAEEPIVEIPEKTEEKEEKKEEKKYVESQPLVTDVVQKEEEVAQEALQETEEIPAEKEEETPEEESDAEEEIVEEKKKMNTNEKILELYKQGMGEVEIAKELEIGLGVVKLVIGLHQKEGLSE
ncbi:MAG: hypothetical protein HFI37_07010 [Lachnospiraceae bacterium]|nr:hypothetical protein [Lachnospiraceae bacterium]